jgi:hypothetical protein
MLLSLRPFSSNFLNNNPYLGIAFGSCYFLEWSQYFYELETSHWNVAVLGNQKITYLQ